MKEPKAQSSPTGTALRMALMALLAAITLSACAEKTMELTVVVFNYWPRPIIDVSVNGQWAGGSYEAHRHGSGGGSMVCCANVSPGEVTVKWALGGPRNAPRLGEEISARAVLLKIPKDAKYLITRIYPDSTVKVSAETYIPLDKE